MVQHQRPALLGGQHVEGVTGLVEHGVEIIVAAHRVPEDVGPARLREVGLVTHAGHLVGAAAQVGPAFQSPVPAAEVGVHGLEQPGHASVQFVCGAEGGQRRAAEGVDLQVPWPELRQPQPSPTAVEHLPPAGHHFRLHRCMQRQRLLRVVLAAVHGAPGVGAVVGQPCVQRQALAQGQHLHEQGVQCRTRRLLAGVDGAESALPQVPVGVLQQLLRLRQRQSATIDLRLETTGDLAVSLAEGGQLRVQRHVLLAVEGRRLLHGLPADGEVGRRLVTGHRQQLAVDGVVEALQMRQHLLHEGQVTLLGRLV